jgi:hypothetical protein
MNRSLMPSYTLNEATIEVVEDMTAYVTPEVLTSCISASTTCSDASSSAVTSVLPKASLYSQLFRSDGFVPQIVRWIAVLTDLATCRGIDCRSAVRTELYPQFTDIRQRLSTAVATFLEKIVDSGNDNLVSAYVHVASNFTGDAVEDFYLELLKALAQIRKGYMDAQSANNKEEWQTMFPLDVLSGQCTHMMIDDLLRHVLSCGASVQTHIQQISCLTELYHSQHLRDSTLCASFHSEQSLSNLLTFAFRAPCYYDIAPSRLLPQGALASSNGDRMDVEVEVEAETEVGVEDVNPNAEVCAFHGIFFIPIGKFLDTAVDGLVKDIFSTTFAKRPAIFAAAPFLLARLREEPAAMTENCFHALAKAMAAINPDTGYIQTIIEAAVTPLTSMLDPRGLLVAAKQANSAPYGAIDFNAILGKLLLTAVKTKKIATKCLFVILFATRNLDGEEALLDESIINEVLTLLIDLDPASIVEAFSDLPSLPNLAMPWSFKIAVRHQKLMEIITLELHKYPPGSKYNLPIPLGYQRHCVAWKMLIQTVDSAFLQSFLEMGKDIIHAVYRERISPKAREVLRQFFSSYKKCMCRTDEGKSAWVSLQEYSVKALKSKKSVQNVLANI